MCRDDCSPIFDKLRGERFETLLDAGCVTSPVLSLLTDRYYVGFYLMPKMICKVKEDNPAFRWIIFLHLIFHIIWSYFNDLELNLQPD